MANAESSRESGPNLADVLAAIAATPGLSKVQRLDLQSAVRTVARVLGRPLEQIPAEPSLLAPLGRHLTYPRRHLQGQVGQCPVAAA
jgi:hypothetical protein